MSIIACMLAASSLLPGAPATVLDGDSVRVIKIGLQGVSRVRTTQRPIRPTIWPKLSRIELKRITVKDGSPPNVGVADFLHLDARMPFAIGKGNLSLGRCSTDLDANYISFDIANGGSVTLSFQAKPEAARYMVDFQVSCGPQAFAMSSTVDGGFGQTTVDHNTHHLIYMLDCKGGTHKVTMYATVPCIVIVSGVDVSVGK